MQYLKSTINIIQIILYRLPLIYIIVFNSYFIAAILKLSRMPVKYMDDPKYMGLPYVLIAKFAENSIFVMLISMPILIVLFLMPKKYKNFQIKKPLYFQYLISISIIIIQMVFDPFDVYIWFLD